MAAFFVGRISIHDPDAYEKYRRSATAITEQFGGRYLVRGGAMEVVEGDWPAERTVVIEFPDMARLRAWYSSPEYQAILPHRRMSSKGDVVFVEGV